MVVVDDRLGVWVALGSVYEWNGRLERVERAWIGFSRGRGGVGCRCIWEDDGLSVGREEVDVAFVYDGGASEGYGIRLGGDIAGCIGRLFGSSAYPSPQTCALD